MSSVALGQLFIKFLVSVSSVVTGMTITVSAPGVNMSIKTARTKWHFQRVQHTESIREVPMVSLLPPRLWQGPQNAPETSVKHMPHSQSLLYLLMRLCLPGRDCSRRTLTPHSVHSRSRAPAGGTGECIQPGKLDPPLEDHDVPAQSLPASPLVYILKIQAELHSAQPPRGH